MLRFDRKQQKSVEKWSFNKKINEFKIKAKLFNSIRRYLIKSLLFLIIYAFEYYYIYDEEKYMDEQHTGTND